MSSPAFGPFSEIFAEGVVLTVGLITTVCFAERCLKRSAPLNVTGFAAGVIAVFYSVYGESKRERGGGGACAAGAACKYLCACVRVWMCSLLAPTAPTSWEKSPVFAGRVCVCFLLFY